MRRIWLEQTDEQILADCETDCYRASGPGGQKRNKTESAIRLRHGPSELAAHATESRSQLDNRRSALRRLRAKFAIELREQVTADTREVALAFLSAPARRSDKARRALEYLSGIATLLDVVAAADYAVGDAARGLGVSTSAVSGAITADPRVHRWVNHQRAKRELKPLRG